MVTAPADKKYGTWVFANTPHKTRVRKLAFTFHKWLGIVLALYMLMMSVTGVSLVFVNELSAWLTPQTHIAVGAQRRSFNQMKIAVERANAHHEVTGLYCPKEKDLPASVFTSDADGNSSTFEVNPYTGKVLGLKPENQILDFLCRLHFDLLFGSTGRTANGFGAIALLMLTATGIMVWWRGAEKWMSGFRLRLHGAPRTAVWSLHSTLGAWAVPLLLIWAVSGVYFGFPVLFEQSVNAVFPVSSQKKQPVGGATRSGAEFTAGKAIGDLDKLAASALRAVPNAVAARRIALASERRNTVRIWVETPGAAGDTQVHLNPVTGKVFGVSSGDEVTAGDLILQWLAKLHFGNFYGTISKCAWVVLGLLPGALSITAIYLFFTGVKRRKK